MWGLFDGAVFQGHLAAMTDVDKLHIFWAVRDALNAKDGESIREAAERILKRGKGRQREVARAVFWPPGTSWEMLQRAAERAVGT